MRRSSFILHSMDLEPPSKQRPQHADDYKIVLQTLKERIAQAQQTALKAVNRELIGLYWDMGRIIVEKQAQLGWGKSVVDHLAKDLRVEFPGIRGFSAQN